uniref:Si:dkey-119m7.8 n=1 Tax=Sinocyclocheilus grahami TaxID=75366 RepID=A0A672SZW3_SINGR
MCARAGGVIAPIIYLLRNISRHAPMVVFGLCPLIGAALTIFLPETAHKPLPDTIEDVERNLFYPKIKVKGQVATKANAIHQNGK